MHASAEKRKAQAVPNSQDSFWFPFQIFVMLSSTAFKVSHSSLVADMITSPMSSLSSSFAAKVDVNDAMVGKKATVAFLKNVQPKLTQSRWRP